MFIRGERMYLPSVQKENAGLYKCMGKNSARDRRLIFRINVEYPPIIDANKTEVIDNNPTSSIGLMCTVNKFPEPNITWYKNNKELTVDSLYKLSNTYNDTHIFTTLNISTSENRFGKYVCRAESTIGAAENGTMIYKGMRFVLKIMTMYCSILYDISSCPWRLSTSFYSRKYSFCFTASEKSLYEDLVGLFP